MNQLNQQRSMTKSIHVSHPLLPRVSPRPYPMNDEPAQSTAIIDQKHPCLTPLLPRVSPRRPLRKTTAKAALFSFKPTEKTPRCTSALEASPTCQRGGERRRTPPLCLCHFADGWEGVIGPFNLKGGREEGYFRTCQKYCTFTVCASSR